MRAYEKLTKLAYSPDRHASVLYYIDEYTYLYKKAYPIHAQEEIVRALVLSLPPNIKTKINYMQDISAINSIDVLKKLAKRYDQEATEEPTKTSPLNLDTFKTVMESVVKDLAQKQIEATKEAVAALLPKSEPSYMDIPGDEDDYMYVVQDGRRQPQRPQYGQSRGNNRGRGGYNYRGNYAARRYDQDQNNRRPYQPNTRGNQQAYQVNQQRGPNGQVTRGPPPGPCWTCQGNHWNDECPNRGNLNRQGC